MGADGKASARIDTTKFSTDAGTSDMTGFLGRRSRTRCTPTLDSTGQRTHRQLLRRIFHTWPGRSSQKCRSSCGEENHGTVVTWVSVRPKRQSNATSMLREENLGSVAGSGSTSSTRGGTFTTERISSIVQISYIYIWQRLASRSSVAKECVCDRRQPRSHFDTEPGPT